MLVGVLRPPLTLPFGFLFAPVGLLKMVSYHLLIFFKSGRHRDARQGREGGYQAAFFVSSLRMCFSKAA
jgi:hypothetical protein